MSIICRISRSNILAYHNHLKIQKPCIGRIYRVVHTNSETPAPAQVEHHVSGKLVGAAGTFQKIREQIGIYDELSKSKLSALVVMTTGAGFLLAGTPICWSSLAAVSVGTSLAACSANTFNQVWEIENDKLMNRTFRRPLPSGRISPRHALGLGAVTAIASTSILAVGCNSLTAALGAFNIGLYSLAYTPLKTKSELNTWVGSVVGAIPPVMGWVAATGDIVSIEAALMASTLYLWQFPHFFALSWRIRKDYARGGFKMVPCSDNSGIRTGKLVLRYSMYLSTVPLLAAVTDVTSWMFCAEGTAVNAYLMYLAHRFYRNPNNQTATKVFHCSLWYLPVVLGLMVFHKKQKENRENSDADQQLDVSI